MGIINTTYYYFNYYTTRTDDADPATNLSSRDIFLVQSSWAPIKKDLTNYGVKLLILLFEKYPEEQQFFPFRDIPRRDLADSKKFHAHCSNVMYSIDSIIDSLKDSELLVNILEKIGRNHHRNKVRPASFWHVKEVMLDFFSTFLNKETVDAWEKALKASFDVVAAELKK